MPLYEYECTTCLRHTEKIQKFSDPEITTCPHCGGALKRVITAPAISFKGGGWYADGYGNAKPSSESKSGSDTTSTPVSTDSKPSASSESSAAPAAAPAAPAAAPAASTSSSDKK